MSGHNPFVREAFACPTCHDFGFVAGTYADQACVACDGMAKETREKLKTEAWVRQLKPPEIMQLDLTAEELEIYRSWKARFPTYTSATLLSWIEGRRYDPAKDPEMKAIGKPAFLAWRASRGNIGPDPEWLRDPAGKDLSKWQREALAALKQG